ncbi:MAG TPA: hypothetical protein VE783_12995 [Candidatus Limnocylindrales bacterium]|jgi:hypothetical protein|nr:hypothetical protein [Candidatus Limnocylindrales bacterium]
MKAAILALSLGLLAGRVWAQEHHHDDGPAGELNAATQAMEHHHHNGPHMHMSTLRPAQPGDQQKADAIVEQTRQAMEKYRDYQAALADGFRIFLPNVPQKMYHFTNYGNAFNAAFNFDPSKPTSLLYEKIGDGYKLIGAMFTAPVGFTEDQLNQRVPLSVAQWHQHVNMCKAPQGRGIEMLGKNPQFGLNGSISTREECEAAGGTFMPHVFGWMVHLYPWEKTSDQIWSVERQLQDKPASSEHQHHDHGMMAAEQK